MSTLFQGTALSKYNHNNIDKSGNLTSVKVLLTNAESKTTRTINTILKVSRVENSQARTFKAAKENRTATFTVGNI